MTGTLRGDSSVADAVLECMLAHYGLKRPAEVEQWLQPQMQTRAFDFGDSAAPAIAAHELRTPIGRIRFHVSLGESEPGEVHPMMGALRQCRDTLALGDEIRHPLESDTRDRSNHYSGVVSIRRVQSAGIALSDEQLPFHQDGLGTAGSVRFVSMCLDQAPVSGGDRSYVNVLAHGIRLANRNWRGFVEATKLDALTIERASGSQRIAVTGPMFYVDEIGIPAVHFRSAGGEYVTRTNSGVSLWFSSFVAELTLSATRESMEPGDCVIVDNLSVAHSRMAFVQGTVARRLSRKWFAIAGARALIRNETSLRLSAEVYGFARTGSAG